ncbi:hypothetical protein M2352_002679 [Azospirillum fermentarium]|uniref:YjfK family protein n=1 Tax=Azospirillum fermentarium TaxID=1233114 RepID=UPI002226D660|nr:YjfK family protein [Azospirillum fermentarium]MCW2247088.1 hypothetical protein [Azospirillum fermentarium]
MRPKRIGKWLRAGFLSALVALQPAAGAPVLRLAAVGAATVLAVETIAPAEARARSSSSGRSSGGYSRPSSSRTPSVGSSTGSGSGGYGRPSSSFFGSSSGSSDSSAAPSRTPSIGSLFGGWSDGSKGTAAGNATSSGGYARPSGSATVAPPPASAGDSAVSRQGSADALNRYRTPPPTAPAPSAPSAPASPSSSAPSSSGGGWFGGSSSSGGGFRYPSPPRTPSAQPAPAPRPYPDVYRGYGWTPPAYAMNGPRRFGIWDGVFLWFMLSTLTQPGHAAFFHDNADDPGYRQWRTEAERVAQSDPQVRENLALLDARVAEQAGTPRQPGRVPADIPAEVAKAGDSQTAPATAPAKSGGSGWVAFLVLVVLAVAAIVILRRIRARARAASAAPSPASNPQESEPMLGSLGNYVGSKLSGQPYRPSLFRVGMAMTIDPTPFILAQGATKVTAPATGGNGLVSVEAVGTLTAGNAALYRLYLPGGGFFQIHLDANSVPDECRYFVPIDQVAPADGDEWAFWLDPSEGMVGWPEFQTKDGKLYARTWMPGDRRVQPVPLSEERKTLRGTETTQYHAMLYGAATGAAEPAPPYEYILVSVVERNGQAWVDIAAGIDVNPAQLSLS